MSRLRCYQWLLGGTVAAACLGIVARPCRAVEEARRFLDGLRDPDRFGYYDTALEYLEMVRNSPLVDEQFKEVIDYEAGVTLTAASQAVRDKSIRERHLDEAQERFQKFLTDHPQHPLVTDAKTELAKVLFRHGQMRVDRAAKDSASAAEKTRLRGEARGLYQEAQRVLTGLEKQLSERFQSLPKVTGPRDTRLREERLQVAGHLVLARLVLAQALYRMAGTHEPGSEENVRDLKAAAKQYHDLYQKYYVEHNKLAGLEARLWEGRCCKDLEQPEKAYEAFTEVLEGPDEPAAFRLVKNGALISFLETALLPGEKKYEKALEQARKWEQTARGAEESSPLGLAIKYLAGEAAFEHAKSMQEGDADARRRAFAEAKQLFDFVASFSGEYQKQARDAARRPAFVGEGFVPPEPTTFAEAADRANEELFLSERDDLKPDEAARARARAVEYFRKAIRMRPAGVNPDDMNLIRYRLAYLYYKTDRLYEAAVAGEFLARRYPNGIGARQGAEIALKAYVRLLGELPSEEDRQFEAARMIGMAEYIAAQWPDEALAVDAWLTLIRSALDEGDLGKAEEYLQRVPADSPRRGEVELMTGRAFWQAYLEASRQPEAEQPPQEVLDKMVEQAQKTLEDGIARMRKSVDAGDEVSPALAAGVLSLVQIYTGAGEPQKAVRWLEDPKIGAATLVAAGHPVTRKGNFRLETHKVALRAYVAAQEVDKAKEAMKHLEELTKEGGDAQAGKKLTQIYVSLGLELQKQLERLRTQKKTEQLAKVSEAFRGFLDRIRLGEGTTFSSLNWVAETFFSLGAGFDPGGKTLAPEARDYYEKAADTYRRILQRADDAAFGLPEGGATVIKIRLAGCLRRLGPYDQAKYDEALDLLVDVLQERNTMVDAQVEAAYVYQARGEQDARYYPLAINGGKRIKKKDGSMVNLVWGWGKIGNLVAFSPKHESIFHEARYNLAYCRFKQALAKRKTEKARLLEQAEIDIRAVFRFYPKMGRGLGQESGGADWCRKYDELLKTIQKLRGKTADGLKGLEASRKATAAG